MNKTVFVSNTSFDDASFKAKMAGYTPIGGSRNKQGEFVVFARKNQMYGGMI